MTQKTRREIENEECDFKNLLHDIVTKIFSIINTSRLYAGGNKYDSHPASRQEDGTQYHVTKSINRSSRTFQNYNRYIIFY